VKFRTLLFALLCIVPFAAPAQAKSRCSTVRQCREVANYYHHEVVSVNANIARALGITAHPKRVPVCHSVVVCQRVATLQMSTRTRVHRVWYHITTDQSVTGAKRATRYWFSRSGPEELNNAFRVESCESQFHWFSWNGLDDGVFQYELVAHPDIVVYNFRAPYYVRSQASIVWWATQRAFRDSNGGRHWSPMWTCATKLGIA
jgi:hypothetical protein